MAKVKSHAQKLQKLSASHVRDFDPEDESAFRSETEDSASDDDTAPTTGREHYEFVGKSTFKKPQVVSLGPKYVGTKVRREALDADKDDENDPFTWASGDSEEEKYTADDGDAAAFSDENEDMDMVDAMHGSSEDDNEEVEDGDTDITDDEDLADEGADDDENEDFAATKAPASAFDRAELQKLMADTKQVASSLSERARQDAERGRAVKQQRASFDTLLNSRIKLQKGLVATNSLLATHPEDDPLPTDEIVEAAEAAAINLWNNLNTLRHSLQNEKSETKRSYRNFTRDDSLDSFLEDIRLHEAAQKKQRTRYLDYWASQTRSTTALPQTRGRLQQTVKEQQLSDVLASQLHDVDRLVAKTLVPRSCAPVQAATASKKAPVFSGTTDGAAESQALAIYDDADFYTTLLASLISQRSADTAVNLSNLTLQPWQAAREARTKKVVDTKASKGRKLRYTVHEKLVSFMAPEDRGTWGETRVDDLFGGLLGRRIEMDAAVADIVESEEEREVQGLRLFGGK